jgi:hypothetical protein
MAIPSADPSLVSVPVPHDGNESDEPHSQRDVQNREQSKSMLATAARVEKPPT